MTDTAVLPGSSKPRRFVPTARAVLWALRLVSLLALAFVLCRAYLIYLGPNFHAVIPNSIYRSAQASPERLKQLVVQHEIRTVVNLRGLCSMHPWYIAQCEAVQDLGIAQEDLAFSAQRMPSAKELERLIEVFDRAERPILLHCRQGADRTGLAAVAARLLFTPDTLDEALRHLSWRYGHLPVGKTVYIDRFFALYATWLRDQGREHAPELFRAWIRDGYRGGWLQHAIESITPLQATCRRGEPVGFKVKVRNVSGSVWRFRPHELAGVHVGVMVYGPLNNLLRTVRAGLFERDVAPGESIEVTLVLPPMPEPGRYRLRFDMLDEEHCWFEQGGAQAREEEIVVQ